MFINKEDFETRNNEKEVVISMYLFKEKSDRTLLYGYTPERDTHHVYIKDGVINLYVYNEKGIVQHVSDYSFVLTDLIPSKRTYPESTDKEFFNIVVNSNTIIEFTSYNQERADRLKDKNYHGKVV